MVDVGIRELKIHASEIVRKVKEKRMRYIITHRGRPVAAIVPIEAMQSGIQGETSAWDELERLGQQISQNWQASQGSAEILADMRR